MPLRGDFENKRISIRWRQLVQHLITILFQSILQMWRESEKYSIAIKLSNSNAAWAGSLSQQLDDAQSAALNNIAKLIGTKAGNLNNLNIYVQNLHCQTAIYTSTRSTTDKSLQP